MPARSESSITQSKASSAVSFSCPGAGCSVSQGASGFCSGRSGVVGAQGLAGRGRLQGSRAGTAQSWQQARRLWQQR